MRDRKKSARCTLGPGIASGPGVFLLCLPRSPSPKIIFVKNKQKKLLFVARRLVPPREVCTRTRKCRGRLSGSDGSNNRLYLPPGRDEPNWCPDKLINSEKVAEGGERIAGFALWWPSRVFFLFFSIVAFLFFFFLFLRSRSGFFFFFWLATFFVTCVTDFFSFVRKFSVIGSGPPESGIN